MFEFRGFPIEQLLRHRRERLQLKFAIEAAQRIGRSDDCAALPSGEGLRLCAINEEALGRWVALLADIYGENLQIGEPRVRYLQNGVPGGLCEPVMHVRMQVRQNRVGLVLRELQFRNAHIVEQCTVKRMWGVPLMSVIRVVAPLARLIGLQKRLDDIADGGAVAVIALSHYEAVPMAHAGTEFVG